MGKREITPAVIKAQQKQMNIPKRIFVLESLQKGWSDETMAREWFRATGESHRHQSFNKMKHAMYEKGQTLEDLKRIRDDVS